ncbi:MAG: methylmalonyl-CoA mutase, partial [Hyphomicrobiaceae bacterium]|nr:methylmalonyl-CoA mutase [Hyphomicrobiaceae bacterium]
MIPKQDAALAAEFEPASREAWLTLVAKVLRGADFQKQLVSATADALAVQPLSTRADAVVGATAVGRSGWYAGGWDVRQRHVEPDPQAANKAILEDLEGGATSVLLQIEAPGQPGLADDAATFATALRGALVKGAAIALDARENAFDAAGSLIETWRAAGLGENERRGAFNYDPLGVLAETGTLTHSVQRACEIAAKLAADTRTMSHLTALLADGRPYHEAGGSEAQELAAML